jgi:hypothetical protein
LNALAKALSRDIRTYQVPVPWRSLKALEPLRGSLCVVLGLPGVGKSAFALNWTVACPGPSVLISLDTELTTQAIRSAAVASGVPMKRVKDNPRAWALYLERQVAHVRAYDLALQPRDILGVVRAEEEYWGQSPAITVVDNVSNLLREMDYNEYRRVFVDLHRVARMGNTMVVALHHVTRSAAPGLPLTLTSGQFAGEQEAEIVLGLWAKHPDYLNVSILKNRNGEADPTGNMYVTLRFDHSNMRITDLAPQEEAFGLLAGVI